MKARDYREMRNARLLSGAALTADIAGYGACVELLNIAGNADTLERLGLGAGASAVVGGAAWLSVQAAKRAPRLGVRFEVGVRRKFRRIASALNLTKTQTKGDKSITVHPHIRRISGKPGRWSAEIVPILGQELEDYTKLAGRFAFGFNVKVVRFVRTDQGTIAIQVGGGELPQSVAFDPRKAFSEGAGMEWKDRLEKITIGLTAEGLPYRLPLLGSHTLVAGRTGAGKGSIIWSLAVSLVPAIEAGAVKMWGFDPKRMELSMGPAFWDKYASDPVEMVELLERAHDDMQQRASGMAGRSRKFIPDADNPLHVLVVDELGYVSSLIPDRKLRERAEKALSAILVLGRSVGYHVMGLLQDPRKETLGFRDLFPNRVAMALPSGMVDLVLGQGSRAAGALCDLIPLGDEGAGTAYVYGESLSEPVCIRAFWVPDELIMGMSQLLADPHVQADWQYGDVMAENVGGLDVGLGSEGPLIPFPDALTESYREMGLDPDQYIRTAGALLGWFSQNSNLAASEYWLPRLQTVARDLANEKGVTVDQISARAIWDRTVRTYQQIDGGEVKPQHGALARLGEVTHDLTADIVRVVQDGVRLGQEQRQEGGAT